MSVESDIRDAIVTLVDAVPDTGTVHNRQRFTADNAVYLSLYKYTSGGDDSIRGWWVTWGGVVATNVPATGLGDTADTWRFKVTGIMGLKDSSDTESTFNNLVLAVVDALRASTHFGVNAVVRYSHTVTTTEPELRFFGSVLCHYCEVLVDMTVVR